MTAGVGWIDFDSEHADKVRTVIDLLATPGVVDELGIGVIRDSFADRMFAGISTIQTRAKYFTLTALLLKDYQEVEKEKRRPRTLERYLEDEEKECRINLVERHSEDQQDFGIIGSSFKSRTDRGVVRRPSSIYWAGLRHFGFIFPPHLSLVEFGRRLSDDRRQLHSILEETSKEKGDDHDAEGSSHQLRVMAPEIDDDYWDTLSIDLTANEAEFLRHQITVNQPDSLIGQILSKDDFMDQVLQMPDSTRYEDFAELPFIQELKSEEMRRTVQHARDFWRILYGAHIRYNCLLQDAGFGTPELQTDFEQRWEEWREDIAKFPAQWDSSFMWALISKRGSRVKDSTRGFIEGWIEESRNGAGNLERCNELVSRQELRNKRNRARLRPGNQESINNWMGLSVLNYRLGEVRQLVQDIRDGESRKEGSHA